MLLIADEVVTGVGRTGRWYASEHFGLVPDPMDTLVEADTKAASNSDSAPSSDRPSQSTGVPVPTPDAEDQSSQRSTFLDSDASAAAEKDTATIDPQLKRALEYLEEHISGPNPPHRT